MPSAGRPFTGDLVASLIARGVSFAPITLHTGVASLEAHELPLPERFSVSEPTAHLINLARQDRPPNCGGRHHLHQGGGERGRRGRGGARPPAA